MTAIVAAIAVRVAAQAPPVTSPSGVSQLEFKRLAAAQKIVIVDVRSADEFREGHIPRALSLPLETSRWPAEYDRTVAALKVTKKPVVLYCACHGETQSIRAAYSLVEEGVEDARVLVGGFNDWVNDGNRIMTGPK